MTISLTTPFENKTIFCNWKNRLNNKKLSKQSWIDLWKEINLTAKLRTTTVQISVTNCSSRATRFWIFSKSMWTSSRIKSGLERRTQHSKTWNQTRFLRWWSTIFQRATKIYSNHRTKDNCWKRFSKTNKSKFWFLNFSRKSLWPTSTAERISNLSISLSTKTDLAQTTLKIWFKTMILVICTSEVPSPSNALERQRVEWTSELLA